MYNVRCKTFDVRGRYISLYIIDTFILKSRNSTALHNEMLLRNSINNNFKLKYVAIYYESIFLMS